MEGLDAYIEGRNDPNNPANQVCWTETFAPVLEYCDWITEQMFDDNIIYSKLGEIFETVVESFYEKNKFYSEKERYEFMKEWANEMALKIKEKYDKI